MPRANRYWVDGAAHRLANMSMHRLRMMRSAAGKERRVLRGTLTDMVRRDTNIRSIIPNACNSMVCASPPSEKREDAKRVEPGKIDEKMPRAVVIECFR